jgi:hypothetical protein
MLPCSGQIVIFRGPSLWHLTTRLNSSPGATKLEPVGPVLIVLLKRQSALYHGQIYPILATVVSCFDHDS